MLARYNSPDPIRPRVSCAWQVKRRWLGRVGGFCSRGLDASGIVATLCRFGTTYRPLRAGAGRRVKAIGCCGPGVEALSASSGLGCPGAGVRCARLRFRTSRGRVGWVRLRRPTRCRRHPGRSSWPRRGGWWSRAVGGWA